MVGSCMLLVDAEVVNRLYIRSIVAQRIVRGVSKRHDEDGEWVHLKYYTIATLKITCQKEDDIYVQEYEWDVHRCEKNGKPQYDDIEQCLKSGKIEEDYGERRRRLLYDGGRNGC